MIRQFALSTIALPDLARLVGATKLRGEEIAAAFSSTPRFHLALLLSRRMRPHCSI